MGRWLLAEVSILSGQFCSYSRQQNMLFPEENCGSWFVGFDGGHCFF